MSDTSTGQRLLRYLTGILAAGVVLSAAFLLLADVFPSFWATYSVYLYGVAAVAFGFLVARAFGATDVLAKPFRPAALLDKVAKLLAG